MQELQKLFNDAVDLWHADTTVDEQLHCWLGLSKKEYVALVEKPTNLFYIFYHNENFQNKILHIQSSN